MHPGSPASHLHQQTCERCRHFTPDPINPPAGMGDCAAGQGMHHPMAKHWCKQHEERRDD